MATTSNASIHPAGAGPPQGQRRIARRDKLIAYVNTFKSAENLPTRLYYHIDPKPQFVAIFNDDTADGPGWGDFKAEYNAPLSKEWQEWITNSGRRGSSGGVRVLHRAQRPRCDGTAERRHSGNRFDAAIEEGRQLRERRAPGQRPNAAHLRRNRDGEGRRERPVQRSGSHRDHDSGFRGLDGCRPPGRRSFVTGSTARASSCGTTSNARIRCWRPP